MIAAYLLQEAKLRLHNISARSIQKLVIGWSRETDRITTAAGSPRPTRMGHGPLDRVDLTETFSLDSTFGNHSCWPCTLFCNMPMLLPSSNTRRCMSRASQEVENVEPYRVPLQYLWLQCHEGSRGHKSPLIPQAQSHQMRPSQSDRAAKGMKMVWSGTSQTHVAAAHHNDSTPPTKSRSD